METSEERELTKENIISEIHNDIEQFETKNTQKEVKSDKYMCRFNLFQFLQLKYLNNKNRDYVGYIMHDTTKEEIRKNKDTDEEEKIIKKIYSLDNSCISTLNRANILEEVKNVKYDDNYFELIKQYYSDNVLKSIFLQIIEKNNIDIDSNSTSLYDMFNLIKEKNKQIFNTYYRKIRKTGELGKKDYVNSENKYFLFRFFKLSEKYQKYETLLYEKLKEEFGWRLKYKIVRNF